MMTKKWLKRKLWLLSILLILSPFVIYNFWICFYSVPPIHDTALPTQRLLPVKNQKTIRVMSVSSGGLDGILSIYPLIYLEEKTGKPISQLFDMFIGVSTGSVAPVLLNISDAQGKPKYTARQVLEFYNQDARKMFVAPWYHRILTLNGFLNAKYLSLPRQTFVDSVLGNTHFEDLLNNVIIPVFNVTTGKPLFFYNWSIPWLPQNENFLVRTLFLSAISPPYFFSPVTVETEQGQNSILSDAVLYLVNPTSQGLTIAMSNYPNKQYILASFRNINELVSTKENTKDWGLLEWSFKMVPLMIDAHGQRVFMDLQYYSDSLKYHTGKKIYYYFTLHHVPNPPAMDDTSSENIDRLNRLGAQLVEENKEQLDQLAWRLTHDGDYPKKM